MCETDLYKVRQRKNKVECYFPCLYNSLTVYQFPRFTATPINAVKIEMFLLTDYLLAIFTNMTILLSDGGVILRHPNVPNNLWYTTELRGPELLTLVYNDYNSCWYQYEARHN